MKWLLLRGLAREQRQWGELPALFEKIVPDAKVNFLDHPGAGTEHKRQSPASIAGITEDLRSRWLHLRQSPDEAWGILGISLGGMVTMDWSARYPSDFSRVVIANSSAADLSVPWRRLDLGKLPGIVAALRETDRVARERRILEMTTSIATSAQKNELAERFARFSEDKPMAREVVLRQLYAASRFRAPSHIAAPVLVLSGGKDPFTDPSCPRRLADHFNAPLATHPDAGHDLSVDSPEWVALEVAKWLGSTR